MRASTFGSILRLRIAKLRWAGSESRRVSFPGPLESTPARAVPGSFIRRGSATAVLTVTLAASSAIWLSEMTPRGAWMERRTCCLSEARRR